MLSRNDSRLEVADRASARALHVCSKAFFFSQHCSICDKYLTTPGWSVVRFVNRNKKGEVTGTLQQVQ